MGVPGPGVQRRLELAAGLVPLPGEVTGTKVGGGGVGDRGAGRWSEGYPPPPPPFELYLVHVKFWPEGSCPRSYKDPARSIGRTAAGGGGGRPSDALRTSSDYSKIRPCNRNWD